MDFLEDQFASIPGVDLTAGVLRRSCGGWEGVEELKRNKEYWRGDERLHGDSSFVDEVLKISDEMIERKELIKKGGWSLDKVISCVSGVFGVEEADIMLKGRGDQTSIKAVRDDIVILRRADRPDEESWLKILRSA